MKHTDIRDLFEDAAYCGREVTVCGWVRTARDSKNMAFAALNDGTTLAHLQLVFDKEKLDPAPFLKLGTGLMVTGTLVHAMRGQGVELNVEAAQVLGECPPEYPLQKKRHTPEYLRTMPHLRVRTNLFNAMLRVRSEVSGAIHEFFRSRHFTYVHTPILTASDCEGAGEVFRVTTMPYGADGAYPEEAAYYAADFFKRRAGLSVSGQLEGEAAAMGMGKIYTFGPSFRAENSNTPRHAAEFWHVEPEVAFAQLPDIMEIAEDMIRHILRSVLERCKPELDFFQTHLEPGLCEKLRGAADSSFGVVTYTEAVRLLQESGAEFVYPVEWGCDLQTEHERYLTEQIFRKPLFVTDYPKQIKAFYMKQNPDGKTVAATDLLVPGVGEIIGCSEREADLDKLLEAMDARGMRREDYADYLDLRRFGSVPHSGFGLGLERMRMYVTGISNIRDVQLYPRTVGNIR